MPPGMYKRTPEIRAKLNATQTVYMASSEARAKISVALAGNQNALGFRGPGIFIHQGRAYVRVYSGWVRRAHAVWVQANGPIPVPGLGRRGDQYNIHHVNEDPLDDRLENLQLLMRSQHTSLHMIGNQHANKRREE